MYNKLSVCKEELKKFLNVVYVIVSEEPLVIYIAAWSVTNYDVEVIDKVSKVHWFITNEQLFAEIFSKGFISVTLIRLKVLWENDLVVAEVQDDSSFPIPLF